MEHPEGLEGANLTQYDDEVWDLKTYVRCLEDVDVLDECFEMCERDLAEDYGNNKHHMRWRGLELLREVDNGLE